MKKIIALLIDQNFRLGQRQIALECACSTLIAQVSVLQGNPRSALDRTMTELGGTAAGVAHQVSVIENDPYFDTTEITATMESLGRMAEAVLEARCFHDQSTGISFNRRNEA